MTVPITLNDVSTFVNDTTAATTVNNNSTAITTAFSSALDTSGDQMEGTLDMNSNQIINLPSPATADSPVRLQDLSTITGGGTVSNLPSGGTTGQVLMKASNSNYAVEWSSASGTGSVTSVGLSLPSDFTVTGSPVTSSGTLTANWATTPTGTGAHVLANSPTLVTPTLGAATATTINGNTISSGTGTLSLGSNTLTAGNTGTVVTSATTAGGNLSGTYPNPTIAAGAVQNSMLANAGGYTLKGNTGVSSGPPSDFTIASLTQKTSPANTDLLIIADEAASGQIKYATVGSIATAGSVSSVNSATGAITIASNSGEVVNTSGSAITIGSPGGLVNKFRNGTMDIWQRGYGATFTIVAGTPSYTADGWIVGCTGANNVVNIETGRSLTQYALGITGNTSTTDTFIKQRIESFVATPMNGQTVTVQAQIYNTTGGAITPTLTVKTPTATDNYTGTSTVVNAASLQVCNNTTWTLVSYTFVATGCNLGLEVTFDFGSNLNANTKSVYITECDIRNTPGLTVGLQSNPPPPELRPIWTEMAFCQRYFESSYNNGVTPSTVTAVGALAAIQTNTTNISIPIYFKVPKRVTPTTTIYSPHSGATGKLSYNNDSADGSASTAGSDGEFGTAYGYTGGSLAVSEYSYVHFTSTAEI